MQSSGGSLPAGQAGRLAALPSDLASALSSYLSPRGYAAFEQAGRHVGAPLTAAWLGLLTAISPQSAAEVVEQIPEVHAIDLMERLEPEAVAEL